MMPAFAELVEQLRWKKFPVLDDGFVCLVDVDGRRRRGGPGRPGELWRGHAAGLRRPHADPLPDAASAHHALRDGRAEVPGSRADGLLAAVDPPPHGFDQRDEHALFDRHRRRAATPADAWRKQAAEQSPGERRLF